MKVTWGKMLVGAAVAAGAVAAFIAVEPFLEKTVVPALQKLAETAGEKIAQAWSWIGQHIIGSASDPSLVEAAHVATENSMTAQSALSAVQQTPALQAFVEPMSQVVEATKNVATEASAKLAESGSAVVKFMMENKALTIGSAGAAGAMIGMRAHSGTHSMPEEMADPEHESFVMREDIRRMQALMQARAAAMGMAPVAGPARA